MITSGIATDEEENEELDAEAFRELDPEEHSELSDATMGTDTEGDADSGGDASAGDTERTGTD